MAQAKSVPRSQLPCVIYSVPVTIKLAVAARGITEADRIEDAKNEARKWGKAAVLDVGDPTEMR